MEGTLGEIRIVAFTFAPRNWASCYGQFESINSNQALYAIIGTYYGGNGVTTFAMPDFRGRVPIQHGQGAGLPNYNLAQKGGEMYHALTEAEMPAHKHTLTTSGLAATAAINCSTNSSANTDDPTGANPSFGELIYNDVGDTFMAPAPVTVTGGVELSKTGLGYKHSNLQPFITMKYVICVEGAFPTRN